MALCALKLIQLGEDVITHKNVCPIHDIERDC